VTEPTPLDRAKATALRYLAASARTEAQVRARLDRAELAPEAEEVVRWLAGLGYLDDAAYAAARSRALLREGRAGPRLAERRLAAAGIPEDRAREAVAAALAETAGAGGGEGEAKLCRALAERRAGTADLLGLGERDRARIARYLFGRGFSGAAVARVLGIYEDR
jgi:regulatory protein